MHRVVFLLVSTLAFVHADDITLRDGKVYKDAKVLSHDATTITILYAEGGATLPIANLSDDLQKKFGGNSDQASETQASDKGDNWKGYRKAQDKYVLVNGQLVTRAAA